MRASGQWSFALFYMTHPRAGGCLWSVRRDEERWWRGRRHNQIIVLEGIDEGIYMDMEKLTEEERWIYPPSVVRNWPF